MIDCFLVCGLDERECGRGSKEVWKCCERLIEDLSLGIWTAEGFEEVLNDGRWVGG
jgi:hypothetical protein